MSKPENVSLPASEVRAIYLLEDSHWWYLALRRLMGSMAGEYVGSPLRILDAGCGTGGNLRFLSALFPRVEIYGVDQDPLAVALAQTRKSGRVSRASVHPLPFRDGVFDLVLSLDVLYMQGVNDEKALAEFRRVLKEGGILLVNLPAFECLRSAHDRAVQTRHRYTAPELRRKLSARGFIVRRLTYWNAFLFPLIFLARKVSPLKGVAQAPASDLKALPPALNGVLERLLQMELFLLRRMDLPFGVSVFAVAENVLHPSR